MKELFISNYPFFGERWRAGKIPNTLPSYNTLPDYDSLQGLLAFYDTPSGYDNWLQGYLDEGDTYNSSIKTMKMADSISNKSQIPVIYLTQAHLSYEPAVVFREPTSEELEMMNGFEICYGGKGIVYFPYGGMNKLPVPSGEIPDYFRGLCSPVNPTSGQINYYTPRYTNIYGEEKWNRIKQMNEKLKKMGNIHCTI